LFLAQCGIWCETYEDRVGNKLFKYSVPPILLVYNNARLYKLNMLYHTDSRDMFMNHSWLATKQLFPLRRTVDVTGEGYIDYVVQTFVTPPQLGNDLPRSYPGTLLGNMNDI